MLRLALLLSALVACTNAPSQALWPSSRFTVDERDRAVLRGLEFIYETALDPENFADYGSDYLWCFSTIAIATSDERLAHRARGYGRQLAAQWRRQNRTIPEDVDADELVELIMGHLTAEQLDSRDEGLDVALRAAVGRFSARDYLKFDPNHEPPPLQTYRLHGAEACAARGQPGEQCPVYELKTIDLDVYYDALITTYFGKRFGVPIGASFETIIDWLSLIRPYKTEAQLGSWVYEDQVYLVTHLVYTHNDYGGRRVDPAAMPDEYAFLLRTFDELVESGDGETFAEYVDTLKAFGHRPDEAPRIGRALDTLLDGQNPDGSWGDPAEEDVYDRYHPTWTAIDALKDYRFESAR